MKRLTRNAAFAFAVLALCFTQAVTAQNAGNPCAKNPCAKG